jgi:uncharacterized protein involved in exopolysaccharide biosynthesis
MLPDMDVASRSKPQRPLDIFDLIGILWSGRWIVLVSTMALAVAGFAYAISATEWYRAEVVLMRNENDQFGGGMSQITGLATLAGLNLNKGGSSQESMAVLKSREFAREFIEGEGLVPVLSAFLQKSRSTPPLDLTDPRDAISLFDRRVRDVSEDKKTGLVLLSVTWTNPEVAADWANKLTEKVNRRLQSKALDEAQRNIDYLRDQMAASTVPSVQQSLSKLLEAEMQKLLLARGNDDYAFRLIDRAVAPKERWRPQRTLICLIAATAGLLLGGCIALLKHLWVVRKLGSRDAERAVEA